MNAVDRIYEEAKSLSEQQRLTLAQRLLSVEEPIPLESIEEAWDHEIRERIARYDDGESSARDTDEVFKDLDKRLGR